MMKLTQKFIAIMLTLVFVLSMVLPMGVLADDDGLTPVTLTFENDYGYTRNGNGYRDKVYHKSVSYMRCRSIYPGHTKISLAGYEEILKNESTTIALKIIPRSDYFINNLGFVLVNDECDQYDFEKLSYDIANGMGFYDASRPALCVKSDGVATATPITIENLDVDTLISVLDENPENSDIALWLQHISGDTYLSKSSGLIINYKENEINNQEYVNSAAEKLSWDIISSEDKNVLTKKLNLPKKFYGVDVSWTSSEPDVINPSSGEVVVDSTASTRVTLTANLTYTNALGDSAVATSPVVFNVVVREPSAIVNGYIPISNAAYTRNNTSNKNSKYGVDNKVYKDVYYEFINFGGVYDAHAQFDLSGYEEILSNPDTKANISFYTAYMGSKSNYAYDYNVYMIADSNDTYVGSDLSHVVATTTYDMFNTKDRPILYTKTPANAIPSSGERGTFSGEVSVKDISDVLAEGTDNSLITLFFDSIYGYRSYIVTNSAKTGLTITYDKNEINNAEYLKEVKDALTWDVLSKGKQDKVSADLYLPTKFKGAKIVWESDNAAITADGKVDFANNKGKTVTLTAKMTYTNILGQSAEAEKEFEVTISDGEYYEIGTPELKIEDNKFKASWGVENYTGADVTYYVYLAAYSDKELVDLKPIEYVAKNGEPTFINPEVKFQEGYTAKLIVLKSDHITPLFAATEK